MIEKKKVVIIGPAGVGKTTIKKVFFEMANPLTLINSTIEPTRGINSKIFKFFNLELGVFDLAGQENKNWFADEKDVFINANLIICVLDVNTYLREIQEFFIKLIKLYREMKLSNCFIVVFLHKVDLIERIYLHHKVKAFKDFVESEMKLEKKIKIYPTSIAEEFFFNTFDYITEILDKIVSINQYTKSSTIIDEFRKDLEILIEYEVTKPYSFDDLFYDFNLQHSNALIHLNRLEKLGFVEILGDMNRFKLTDKASFFKSKVKKDEINQDQNKINRILDALFLFSNLNDK